MEVIAKYNEYTIVRIDRKGFFGDYYLYKRDICLFEGYPRRIFSEMADSCYYCLNDMFGLLGNYLKWVHNIDKKANIDFIKYLS